MDIVISRPFDLTGYGGKLFKVGVTPLTFKMTIPTASESGETLVKFVEKGWGAEIDSFLKERTKEYHLALKEAEVGIYKRAAKLNKPLKEVEKWLDEEVKGAQIMINRAVLTLKSLVPTKAKEFYEKASAAFDKKFNTAMRSIKIIAALDIARDVTIVLAAGGLALVAAAAGAATTVLTGGAGVVSFAVLGPIIATSLGVAAKATIGIVGSVSKNLASHKKSMKDLSSAVKDLAEAVEYEGRKKTKSNLGPKESLKLLLTNVKGKTAKVKEAVSVCHVWRVALMKDVENFSMELQKATKVAADAQDKSAPPEVSKQGTDLAKKIEGLQYQVKNTQTYLDAYNKALDEAAALIKTADKLETKSFTALLGKLQDFANDDTVQGLSTLASPMVTAAQSLGKLVVKVA